MGENPKMGKKKKLLAFLSALQTLVYETVCLILNNCKVEDIYSKVIKIIPSLTLEMYFSISKS